MEISRGWDVDDELWDRNWTSLSGGEAQRIALAAAMGLNTAEVLLLDGKIQFLSRCLYFD
jgi:ABC-type dipeptide/oligopeptide/nickel transport system ATPase subunit